MAEYNITKIIDGLFVSDQAVSLDFIFLGSNKIIKLLGWTALPISHQYQQEGIEEFQFSKNIAEVKFPPFQQLQQGFAFLEAVHEQMLCGLIYSQSAIQAGLICIMYLMRKFKWNCNSAYSYLRSKMEIFQFSDQAIEELELYEYNLKSKLKFELSNIIWDYQFLQGYRANSDEEAIIVTTVKNKLRLTVQKQNQRDQRAKKIKRVKWSDQLRPSSAFSINSAKNIAKSSLLKGRVASPKSTLSIITPILQQEISTNKDLELLYQSSGFKHSLNTKNGAEEKRKSNGWQENSQYMQLKGMSRTHFNDYRNFSKQTRRRGSLKPKQKDQNLQKPTINPSTQSINTLIGIYSNKTMSMSSKALLYKSSSAQNFLSGLRACNSKEVKNA